MKGYKYADKHQEIKMLAAQENREMREIIATAFDFYKKYRNSIKEK